MAAIVVSVAAIQARDRVVAPSELPGAAQALIQKHFGNNKINHVIAEGNMFGIHEYDVTLTDGTELEFDTAGNLKEVYCSAEKGLPADMLPKGVTSYIKKYFPNQKVVKLEVKKKKYEVELRSGVELEFDKSGNFLRADN